MAVLSGTSYTWFNINFDSGVDGWVADIGLTPIANQTPTYSSANQYRTDTGTAIPLNGGVIPTGVGVNFKANVSDADGDTIKYEVELRQLPGTFTGVATHSSGFVSSGSLATTATASGLAAGNYGWKFRVIDSRGAATSWSSAGNPDFVVQAVNQTPTYSSANQYRTDTGTAIPLNGGVIPTGVGVNFKANVSDADGDTIKYEVELRQLPGSFTGVATHSSGFVNSGSLATTATANGLAAGNYGWKFRVIDSRGAATSWSSAGNPDFVVQGVNQTPTYSSANQYRTDTGTAIPLNGGVIPTGVGVNFKANVSDADGDTIKYEVELRQLPAVFTGVATHSSGFVASGSQATTATASGLAAGNYGWKFRVIDSRGAANAWSSAGNPDFVVQDLVTPPSITSVTPNPITANAANAYQTLTINGANFVNKPTLVLTWTGQPGYTLPASQVTYVSSSQLTMSVRLGASADNWTVKAINPDSQQSSAVGFQVLAPGISTTDGFDYPIGNKGRYTEAIDGDGWYVATAFNEYYIGNGKYHLGEDWNAESGGNTDYGSPVYAIANGTIVFAGPAVVSGWGNVLIIRHRLPDGTLVESLYGHVASFVRTSGNVTRGEQVATIGDGGGLYTAHLHLEVRLATCPYWGSEGVGYSVTPAPVGWTDPSNFIDARRPSGTGPAPSISSVSPNPVAGSASQQTINVNGVNFVNKPTLTLTWTGQPGYTVPSAQVTYVNSTLVQMAITTTTTPDNWTVRVTNPDGQSSSQSSFTVITPTAAPSITSVSPDPITADAANAYQTLTINGANFVNKPTLVLTWTGQSGYTLPASQVNYVNSAQVTISIRLGASADNWTVKAINPDTQQSNVRSFQVLAPATAAPSISSVAPNPVTGSASQQIITINGANFVNKPALTLTWTGQPGYTVPASQVTFVNGTQLQMAITTTTAPDNWTVRVTNPNGQSSGQSGFTVTGVAAQPNLVPQNVTLSSYSVQAGSQVSINWTIANQGGANCPASVTGLRLGQSPSSHPTSDPALNSSFSTPAINAGLSAQQNTTVTIPANTAAGTYYIWVIADNVANSTLHQTSTADDYAHAAALTVSSGPSIQGEPASLGAIWFSSPNFENRPAGQAIDTIVIHTSQGGYASAKSILTNPDPRLNEEPIGVDKRVSAHYVISEAGEISQLVALDKRAWHATYYNARSIGIEMAGYAEQQGTWNAQNLASLKKLVAYLVVKYNIPNVHPSGDGSAYPSCLFTESGLVAHSQIQPGCNSYALKTDPGLYFPWATFLADVQALVDAPHFAAVGGAGISGQFQIQVSTPSQQAITIQASDDLLNWIDVGVMNVNEGKSVFSDTDAGAHTKGRFYRPKQ